MIIERVMVQQADGKWRVRLNTGEKVLVDSDFIPLPGDAVENGRVVVKSER